MCLIAFDWQPTAKGDQHQLLLIANRDEFFERPTLPLHWWQGDELLAGKDQREGGTWMGVTRKGRFAALTNYRSPNEKQSGMQSRGHIVTAFLRSSKKPADYLDELSRDKDQFNGFNLICADLAQQELWYYSNRGANPLRLDAGLYGVSNALLDTPWPKVNKAKAALKNAISLPSAAQAAALKNILCNSAQAADEALPHTGIAPDWEKRLSAVFIAANKDEKTPTYGTRSSSVLRISEDEVSWHETTTSDMGKEAADYSFVLNKYLHN
jgi:uncharacterized protein with NRDE domain